MDNWKNILSFKEEEKSIWLAYHNEYCRSMLLSNHKINEKNGHFEPIFLSLGVSIHLMMRQSNKIMIMMSFGHYVIGLPSSLLNGIEKIIEILLSLMIIDGKSIDLICSLIENHPIHIFVWLSIFSYQTNI